MTWIFFVLGAVLCWGLYGPAVHRGQVALGLAGAEAGEVVRVGQTIVTVAQYDGVDAVFNVPASLMRQVSPDALITVTLTEDPSIRTTGRVREAAPTTSVDPTAHGEELAEAAHSGRSAAQVDPADRFVGRGGPEEAGTPDQPQGLAARHRLSCGQRSSAPPVSPPGRSLVRRSSGPRLQRHH